MKPLFHVHASKGTLNSIYINASRGYVRKISVVAIINGFNFSNKIKLRKVLQ